MVLKEASQQISEKPSCSQSLLSAIPPHTSSLHFPPYQIYHPNNPCTSIKTDKNLILFPQCTWHCEILSGCKIFRKGDRKIALVHCINFFVCDYEDEWKRFSHHHQNRWRMGMEPTEEEDYKIICSSKRGQHA